MHASLSLTAVTVRLKDFLSGLGPRPSQNVVPSFLWYNLRLQSGAAVHPCYPAHWSSPVAARQVRVLVPRAHLPAVLLQLQVHRDLAPNHQAQVHRDPARAPLARRRLAIHLFVFLLVCFCFYFITTW